MKLDWVDEIGQISDRFELEIMHLTQDELKALIYLCHMYKEGEQ